MIEPDFYKVYYIVNGETRIVKIYAFTPYEALKKFKENIPKLALKKILIDCIK